jgi:hypothetical protein
VREERATPGRLSIGDAAGHHVMRQPLNRTSPQVDQSGLSRQAFAVFSNAHQVTAALTQATAGDDLHFRAVPVDVRDLFAQPTSHRSRVEFGLDDDVTADQVQRAGEAKHRGKFRLARGRLRNRHPAQFVLDRCGHCHS